MMLAAFLAFAAFALVAGVLVAALAMVKFTLKIVFLPLKLQIGRASCRERV